MNRERVQVPAYTDAWMMGDRFGEIVKITTRRVVMNHTRSMLLAGKPVVEVAHVKMDISGKVRRFLLNDCNPVV